MQIWKKWKHAVVPAAMVLAFVSGTIWYAKEYTTVGNSVNGHEMPICSVGTEEKRIALTFETAWGEELTESVLDILKENNVKATFFVTSGWMEKHRELIKRMENDGHDIGSLGVSHENLSQKNSEEQKQELKEAKEIAQKEGITIELFRPPYGRYNDALIRAAQDQGLFTVCWSVDSMDWKNYGAKVLINNVVENDAFESGAIIRMNSEAADTKEALQELIKRVGEKGYEMVKISEMIFRENYHMDVKGRQISGMT